MLTPSVRAPMAVLCAIVSIACLVPARSWAAGDELSRVRARGFVRCAGIVRPGIAVPTADGKRWFGVSPDICRAVAAAIFGDGDRIAFRPYAAGEAPPASPDSADDIVFLSAAELLGDPRAGAAGLQIGPAVVHDAIALLVPTARASHAADLSSGTICVEPGSPADRALTRYFAVRAIPLHEHPYQETDEMRQAYGDRKCDALAGPLSTLASVRADPDEGRRDDRILPEMLADDPIFAATGGDATWSRLVWWTFSALVDAGGARVVRGAFADDAISGVPPAIGRELGLRTTWSRDAIDAVGTYDDIFDRNLGSRSRFNLSAGENATIENGGSIFGFRID